MNSSLVAWEFRAYVATGVVMLGCVGEAVVEFTTWITGPARKHFGRVSALVLIAGVAAEILTQAEVNTISNQEIADLNSKASGAAQRAASADFEAGRLGVDVENLRGFVQRQEATIDTEMGAFKGFADSERRRIAATIEELHRVAGDEKRETDSIIGELGKDRADLDKARTDALRAAEAAEAALTTFRNEAGSRFLTSDQRTKLIAALRGRMLMPLRVESAPGDVEAYPYAMQFVDAVRAAGLKADWGPFPSPFYWMNGPGVYVWEGGEGSKKSGEALLQALRAAGIEAQEAVLPKDDAAQVKVSWLALVIWHQKPPPPAVR
jgi:hypothetical protein